MNLCPGCDRPSFYPRRNGNLRSPIPNGYLSAVTADGTCTRCWRLKTGKTRPTVKGLDGARGAMIRRVMTDDEIEAARRGLARMAENRRRRGIPADGLDPERIQRRGLSLLEA